MYVLVIGLPRYGCVLWGKCIIYLVITPSVVMQSVTVLAAHLVWKGHLVSWDGTYINASLFTVADIVGDRKKMV